ncbi:MAG: DUF4249 domain-containing protein [Croceivirga sp.]
MAILKKEVLFLSIFSLLFFQCVEELEIVDEDIDTLIEDILVVEATITNELKRQVVYLSYGKGFSKDTISPVQNATVRILNDSGEIFSFVQSRPGKYLSESPFQALQGIEYQLEIENEGKIYQSENTVLPTSGNINRVFAEKFTNDEGVDGIGIFVDALLSEEQVPFLRYTYEETYKIIAPLWTQFDMVVLDPNFPYDFGLIPRAMEKRVCYATNASNDIIQNQGIDLTGDTLDNIMVRFIPRDNPIISHRYSILVNQLVQSNEAFAFYQALKKNSTSNSIFTDVQAGFIEGNIRNARDREEMVLGYFEVANQSNSRIFLNYEDFYPEEPLPPYFINCDFVTAPQPLYRARDRL